jgi:hypothetical protein
MSADDPPYILDIDGLNDSPESGAATASGARRWIGVQFECCGVYTRIYRNREATAYEGSCPKCLRKVRVKVGRGGTSQRMFRAR